MVAGNYEDLDTRPISGQTFSFETVYVSWTFSFRYSKANVKNKSAKGKKFPEPPNYFLIRFQLSLLILEWSENCSLEIDAFCCMSLNIKNSLFLVQNSWLSLDGTCSVTPVRVFSSSRSTLRGARRKSIVFHISWEQSVRERHCVLTVQRPVCCLAKKKN